MKKVLNEFYIYLAGVLLTLGIGLVFLGYILPGILIITVSIILLVLASLKVASVTNKNKTTDSKQNLDEKQLKIVVIGGGTGLPIVLRGLKKHTSNLTAVVTMGDNGGSTGMLRQSLGVLPPGDIRNCIISLANDEEELSKLLNYRFTEGELSNQNLGNILIAGMEKCYGGFDKAITSMSNILAITGEVLPSTYENIDLVALMSDGNEIVGEQQITDYAKIKNVNIDKLRLNKDNVKAPKEVIRSIKEADAIIIGPGSLFTSLISNLLIKDISEEIKSSRAKKIYISNIVSQDGETSEFSLLDHLKVINEVLEIKKLDSIIINTKEPSDNAKEKYKEEKSAFIKFTDEDREFLKKNDIKYIQGDYLYDSSDVLRHCSDKLASEIINQLNI